MDIRETSLPSPVSRTRPQTATQAVVFPRPLIRAVAAATGYFIGFAGEDHRVGLPELGLDNFGRRDWGGNWDNQYERPVFFTFIAE